MYIPDHASLKNNTRFHISWLLWSGGIAFAVVLVWWLNVANIPQVERDKLWIGTVQQGTLELAVKAPGSLRVRDPRLVVAPAAGVVTQLHALPGTKVTKGETIAMLKNPGLVQAVAQAKSQWVREKAAFVSLQVDMKTRLLEHKSTVALKEGSYKEAQLEQKAYYKLYQDHIVSELEYRRTKLKTEQAKIKLQLSRDKYEQFKHYSEAQLNAARTELDLAKYQLANKEKLLAQMTVIAEKTGILQEVYIQQGEHASAGARLVEIIDPDNLVAELRVDEQMVGMVQLGQAASLQISGETIKGKVVRIDPSVDRGTVAVDIVPLSEWPENARPKLAVQGKIMQGTLENTLYVDTPIYANPNSKILLFRVLPDGGAAKAVTVSLGAASVRYIQVLDGLQAGEKIILSDMSDYQAATRVAIN